MTGEKAVIVSAEPWEGVTAPILVISSGGNRRDEIFTEGHIVVGSREIYLYQLFLSKVDLSAPQFIATQSIRLFIADSTARDDG